MESNNNIKVKVVVKFVEDNKEKGTALSSDNVLTLDQMKDFILLVSGKDNPEEIDKNKIISVLKKFKRSHEVLADGMIDIDRDDLFNDKLDSIELVEQIINQISKI